MYMWLVLYTQSPTHMWGWGEEGNREESRTSEGVKISGYAFEYEF